MALLAVSVGVGTTNVSAATFNHDVPAIALVGAHDTGSAEIGSAPLFWRWKGPPRHPQRIEARRRPRLARSLPQTPQMTFRLSEARQQVARDLVTVAAGRRRLAIVGISRHWCSERFARAASGHPRRFRRGHRSFGAATSRVEVIFLFARSTSGTTTPAKRRSQRLCLGSSRSATSSMVK